MRLTLFALLAACSSAAPRTTTPEPTPEPVKAVLPPPSNDKTIGQTGSPARMVFAESETRFEFRDPDRRKKLEAAFPAVEKALEAELKGQGLGGVAVGIVIDGELAWSKGFGVTSPQAKTAPDADTVYRIGSITKSFTGLALLALRDEGVVGLDDPLTKWIPEAQGLTYPTRDSRPITLRQLGNHTSGLPRMGMFEPETGPTDDIVVKSLAKTVLESTPGTRWNYSNLGFGLLGLALGNATKTTFHEVVESRIVRPLGMTATVWDHEKVPATKLAPSQEPKPNARLGAWDGAGGIYSSVRDMAKYVAWQLSAYPPRNADDTGIRRATLREAHSTGVSSGEGGSYGFGWGKTPGTCRFDDLVGHNGAIDSYRADVLFSPSKGVGVIAMTNFGNGNTRAFAERALAELDKTGALVPRTVEASPVLAESMKKLLGVYHTWDEAALKAILARPVDPREQNELATYKQLHGNCTDITLAEAESQFSAKFDVKCERGALRMAINTDHRGGIQGFFGFSTGVTPPAPLAAAAKAVVAMPKKWDDKVFAKHLAKGVLSAAVLKKHFETFHARHGDCTIKRPLHEGFDWGFELACKKENVELWVTTMPNDASHIQTMNLRPVRGEPKKCD